MPSKKTKKPTRSTKKQAPTASRAALSAEPAGPGSYQAYVDLRTRLDAIEIGALYYFTSAKTDEDRNLRAEELLALLSMPVKEVQLLNDASGGCPPGQFNCNGECVPYPCT
jgi:hypothetical protein